jgi:hypothetical protein
LHLSRIQLSINVTFLLYRGVQEPGAKAKTGLEFELKVLGSGCVAALVGPPWQRLSIALTWEGYS